MQSWTRQSGTIQLEKLNYNIMVFKAFATIFQYLSLRVEVELKGALEYSRLLPLPLRQLIQYWGTLMEDNFTELICTIYFCN